MTSAPPMLLQARQLLLDYLDMHPGEVATDLDPDEVGIVGDPSHIGGYHCGKDRVRRNSAGTITDYSVVESTRDRAGLSDYASALDVGQFTVASGGRTWTLLDFNRWLVDLCVHGNPDTADVREVIYTPDGLVVRRWDRLGRRTTGDASHLKHTHISEFRDAHGRRMVALMTRWLVHIGLIGDDMDQNEDLVERTNQPGRSVGQAFADLSNLRDFLLGAGSATPGVTGYPKSGSPLAVLLDLPKQVEDLRARVDTLTQQPVDVVALAAALAPLLPVGASAEQIRQVVDEELDEQSRAGADAD